MSDPLDETDFFDIRVYGPSGWSAPLVALLKPHVTRLKARGSDLSDFYGLSMDGIAELRRWLVEADGLLLSPEDLVRSLGISEALQIASQVDSQATVFHGLVVDPSRGDERVEITHVDVTLPKGAPVASIKKRLFADGHRVEASYVSRGARHLTIELQH